MRPRLHLVASASLLQSRTEFHTVSYSETRLACVLVGSESVCSIRFTRCEQPATPTFTAQSASPYSGNYERKLSLDAAPTVVSSSSERSAEYYAVFRSVHRPMFFFKAVSLERESGSLMVSCRRG